VAEEAQKFKAEWQTKHRRYFRIAGITVRVGWRKKTRTTYAGRAGDCQTMGALALVTLVTASPSPIITILVIAWFLWARLCHTDFSPIQFLAIELGNSRLGGAIFHHLDEGEPLGAARHAVHNEAHRGHLSHCSEKLG
jgi:hypothetical protein